MRVLRWLLYILAAFLILAFAAAGQWALAFVVVCIWVVGESVRRLRTPTSVVEANLDLTENLIRAGALKGPLKTLERMHRRGVEKDDAVELERVVRLVNLIAARAGGRTKSRASWLARAAQEDLVFVRRRLGQSERAAEPAPPSPPPSPQPSGLADRLRVFGVALSALVTDADALRPDSPDLTQRLAGLNVALEASAAEASELRSLAEAEERRRAFERAAAAAPPPPPTPAPAPPLRPEPAAPGPSLGERLEGMGPRLFAWAGGIVMLLGVVFLFAFATKRGWIGPEARLVMGGIVSTLALLAGVWIRRRYGALYSALAAVGVGIAGLYTTVLAAAALYDYLPPLGALACAALIASVGTAVSLAWSAEIVAGLALVGAMLLPIASLLQGDRSLLGLSFVAVMMAATGVVAIRRGWLVLLLAGVAASAPQVVVFVGDSGSAQSGRVTLLVLTGLFWAVYVGTGIAYQLALRTPRLEWLTPSLVLTPGLLLSWASSRLLARPEAEGAALLGLAAVYVLLGAAFMRMRTQRDLSTLLLGAAAVVAVFGFADLLSGEPLAVVWAAQAPLLAWLAQRTGEMRFRIAAAGYLVLAVGHVLTIEAPPRDLFVALAHSGHGAWSVALVAVAAFGFARFMRTGPEPQGTLDDAVAEAVPAARLASLWAAGLLSLYALSLSVLELAQLLGGGTTAQNFETGHVALSVVWSALGLALVLVGLSRRLEQMEWAGLGLLSFAVGEAIAFDWTHLSAAQSAVCLLSLAAGALLAGHAQQLERPLRPEPAGLAATLASFGLASAALLHLLSGDGEGLALLALACVFAAFSVLSHRRRLRELATLDWALALLLFVAACAELLSGLELVAVGSAAAASLAWLSRRAREPRLLLAAASMLALSLGYTLVQEAPPSDLFLASSQPGLGAASVFTCALAAFVLAAYAAPRERLASLWAAGLLSLYALSLSVLELAQALGRGTVEEDFHAGHTAVSGTWALLALVFLYLGLTRRARLFQLIGFGFFGLVLAKIFFFDLPSLSSVTRALSFLAVGALLLTAGYFYQRLAQRVDDGPRPAGGGL